MKITLVDLCPESPGVGTGFFINDEGYIVPPRTWLTET